MTAKDTYHELVKNALIITNFPNELGQILLYRVALEQEEPDRILYLAIPKGIYKSFFKKQLINLTTKKYSFKIVLNINRKH